jgi:hypothetical protein
MLLVTNIDKSLVDILKHVIGENIHMKAWKYQCEMEKMKKITTLIFKNNFKKLLRKLNTYF